METVSPHFGKRDILTLRCVSTHETFSPADSKFDFENDSDYANFIADIRARSLIDTSSCIDVNAGDPSYGLPVISGFRADVYLNKDNYLDVHKVEVFDTNGKKLCKSKKYKVVTNSYVTSILASPRHDQGTMPGCTSSDLLKAYLESQQSIRPDGDRRLRIIEE